MLQRGCWEVLLVAGVALLHCMHGLLMAFRGSQARAGSVFLPFNDPFHFILFLEKPQQPPPSPAPKSLQALKSQENTHRVSVLV